MPLASFLSFFRERARAGFEDRAKNGQGRLVIQQLLVKIYANALGFKGFITLAVVS